MWISRSWGIGVYLQGVLSQGSNVLCGGIMGVNNRQNSTVLSVARWACTRCDLISAHNFALSDLVCSQLPIRTSIESLMLKLLRYTVVHSDTLYSLPSSGTLIGDTPFKGFHCSLRNPHSQGCAFPLGTRNEGSVYASLESSMMETCLRLNRSSAISVLSRLMFKWPTWDR